MAFTGAGTAVLSDLYKIHPVNEVVAQAKATMTMYPEVRTIIEVGGEDSKLILLEEDPKTGRLRLKDFGMNTLCAAGTGSFLDQQASRLGINIEGEWGEMALKSVHVPRIAGRCSVFAKSDMIHLQQEGTPDFDIVAGLCFAMARNFKAVIGKGKDFRPRIAFQGGVAANAGMIRAFTETLELEARRTPHPQALRLDGRHRRRDGGQGPRRTRPHRVPGAHEGVPGIAAVRRRRTPPAPEG